MSDENPSCEILNKVCNDSYQEFVVVSSYFIQIIGFRPKAGSTMAKNSPFSPADFQNELANQIATVAVSVDC